MRIFPRMYLLQCLLDKHMKKTTTNKYSGVINSFHVRVTIDWNDYLTYAHFHTPTSGRIGPYGLKRWFFL